MAEDKKTIKEIKTAEKMPVLFTKENKLWMLIGGVVVLIGFFLMSGGKNTDTNTFDPHVVYSTTRITVAPIIIIAGLMIEVYAIFKKPKQTNA